MNLLMVLHTADGAMIVFYLLYLIFYWAHITYYLYQGETFRNHSYNFKSFQSNIFHSAWLVVSYYSLPPPAAAPPQPPHQAAGTRALAAAVTHLWALKSCQSTIFMVGQLQTIKIFILIATTFSNIPQLKGTNCDLWWWNQTQVQSLTQEMFTIVFV